MIDRATIRQMIDLFDNRAEDVYGEEGEPTQELNELVAKLKLASEGKTLSTVNVMELETVEGVVIGMASYPDDKEGNQAAEQRFKDVARENGEFSDEQLEDGIEDGSVEHGTWKVVICHSTV